MSKDSIEPNKSLTRRESIDGLYRLSGLQHGMLFHGLYDPGTGAYINQFECDIYKLDFDIFRKSWDYVLKSHTILRSVFYHDKLSMPVQCVFKDVKTPMEILDYRNLSEDEQNKAIKEYKDADRIKGFDFNIAPMMRLVLIRLDDERYRMIWTYHHIIFDGWSIPIMMAEFLNAYEDQLSGKELVEKEVDRFEDFIRYVERIDKEKAQNYWKDYLKNVESGCLLPFIGKTSNRTKGAGAYKADYLEISSEITSRLQNYAKRNRITPNTVMQGVWSYCLHRYTGNKDVIFGVIVSGRPEDLPGVEQRVGLFINPLPLHSELIEDQKVTGWLQELQDDQFASRKYQNTSLVDIQNWTGIEGDMFECLLTFENYPVSKLLAAAQWSLKVENVQTSDKNNYPLTIIISLTDQISIRFNYNTALLREEYVKEIMNRFENVLIQFIENEDNRLKDIEILTKPERQKLLTEFNVSSAEYPHDKNIVELFEEQVMKTPDADAIVFEGKTLTYRELNERSNKLAHYLRSKGVKEDTMVPLYIERGSDMMIGLIGILKAGAAYVPIDTDLPTERISFILQDTAAKIIVSSELSSSKLRSFGDIEIVELDNSKSPVLNQPTDNLKTQLTPENLAYVIYTSGSTGNPKGVMIEHKNLVDYAYGLEDKIQINNCRSFALVSTIATDLGNTVIYNSLLSGGALHIFSKDTTSHVEKLHDYFDEHSIECMKIVPSHWKALHLGEKNLLPKKLLIFGGEALHSELVESIRSGNPECRIVNHYGPTETTIGKLLHVTEADRKYDNTIPIGKPFSNTTVYVLSKELTLCPVGVPGQLYIEGVGLARGYLNNEDLTNEKFIKNPFSNTDESRMYATGDLVKYLPDGNIEFIGRADDQVKIRGYRIETGEIENVLQKCELVRQAVVLTNEDSSGNKRLVAYVIPEGEFERDKILSWLKEKVPEYMLPAVLVEMESFPLTPNGKIDRKSLPDPDVKETLSSEYSAPRNEAEMQLTELWKELLDLEEIGIHDNFFELGGDSIISIQLVSRARRLGYEFLIGDVFTYQTIARLSALLDQRSDTTSKASDEQYVVTGPSGLLPIQQWYFEKEPEEVSHFNQYVLLEIDKGITDAILKRAVEQLTAHHDALRFKYFKKDGVWNQVYESDTELSGVIIEDLRSAEKGSTASLISEKASHYQKSLDIEKGEIFKVVLIQTPATEAKNRLLILIHHLAVDGVSWRILFEDLEMLIGGFKGAGKTDLGKKSSSYSKWYETLEKYGQSKRLNSQIEYWDKVISNIHSLPVDKKYDGAITAKDITHHKLNLDSEATRRLIQEVPKVYHTEINDILLAALAKTLIEWSGSDKVTIGMEGHGRENIEEGIDATRTIGWFTTHYPVLLEINRDENDGGIIKSVKEQLRQVPDKGLGFGVLKYINKVSSLQSASLPDIIFNYLGQADNVLNASQWFSLAEETAGSERSEKFVLDNKISLSGIVQGGELIFDWRYSEKNYDQKTIERIADEFQKNLKSLISHSLERLQSGVEYTPSDYGIQEYVNYEELDKFLNEPYNGKPRRDSLESLYKLSGLQNGMLFHSLYEGGAGSYVRQLSCELTGADLNILKESWQNVLKRHSILRSAFYHDSFSIPVQCVYREAEIPVEEIDLRSLSDAEQAMSLKEYKELQHDEGFDFKAAPLMRFGLIRLSEDRYYMLWTWHHILFDGWSLPVLMEEFLTTYKALSGGKLPEIKDADNYEDFIRYTGRLDKDEEESYWTNYMKGIEQSTLLPFIGSKTERTKGEGEYKSVTLELNQGISAKTHSFAQAHRLTVNTIMQGIWSFLLHNYAQSNNIAFGNIVSGRPHDLPGVERRVGLYINALPVHSVLNEEQSVVDWMKDIQQQQIAAGQFQYTPLNDIQRWTGVKGDLFDTLLVFENYPINTMLTSVDWGLKVDNPKLFEQNNYPLTVMVTNEEQLSIEFKYNSRLLGEIYIKEIVEQFEYVLKQILDSKERMLKDLTLLDDVSKRKFLFEFNETAEDYPKDRSIADLFEEQALKTPDSTAVVFDEEQITYKQLNDRSNQLANYLIEKGIKPGSNIGLLSYRNFDMIIGMLGILKAGCAYVPFNKDYPADRLKYIIKDAGIKNIVYTNIELLNSSGINEYDCIDISDSLNSNADSTHIKTESNSPVYIMYTSGTTGNPKGIVVCNSNVTKLVYEPCEIKVNTDDRMLQWSNYSFDGCVYEIYSSLLKGASLHLIKDDAASNVYELARVIKEQGITVCFVTTALFNAFIDIDPGDLKGLRKILFGGEMVSLSHVQRALDVLGPGKIVHVYGPTETTVYATYYPIDKIRDDGIIPIGGPLANTQLYVLNNNMQPVPVGVQGELLIGGDGVALGYINNESLTKEKFVTNPFSKNGNDRLYRTGDLVRWLPEDNSIEFLGRIDNQVKIRGYRIELGEIESILQQHESVKQAAVVAVEDKQGTKRLVGYIAPDGLFDRDEIVTYLEKKLPDYMVPSQFVELESFPLNSSGKIDRKALPDPEANELLSDQFAEPRNDTEKALAELWMELLEVDKVGINDDFFELGGHSLLAIRLISAIRRSFEIEVDINSVFEYTTLQSLADYIQTQSKGISLPAITKQERPERIPLTFSQERLWFIDQLEGSVQYHVPAVLRLKGNLNIEALEHSLQTVVNRHEILRTVILQHEGQAYQQIKNENECKLRINNGTDFNNNPDALNEHYLKLIKKPFDLSKDNMIRAELITLGEQEFMLVVTMHHIISDAWSMVIMVKEVVELYRSYIEGREAELPTLQIQYADYAIWQRNFLQGELFESKLVHWKNKLNGVIPLNLPTDFQRSSVPSTSGASASFLIERELSEQLNELSQQQGSSLYMTLLSAFSILLQRYSGQSDICVGTSIASRQQHEIEGLIGFFVNTLALRSDVNTDLTFREFLNQVKRTTLEAYEHQDVPFEKIVDAVVKERDPSRSPLFQVMLVLLNTPDVPELQLGDVELTNEKFENDVAKFEITFFINETPDGLKGSVQYRSDLFTGDTLSRMIVHFKELLKSIVKDPAQKVGLIPMLTEEEEIDLLANVNSSSVNYPKDKSLADLFEEQVRKTPDAESLVFEDQKLSYRELNERANQLAHLLRSKGVKEETLVPLYIERGLDMMVGILGILKSGAAYVPVETDFPQDRIGYMLEDTGSAIIVSNKKSSSGLSFKEGVEIINIEDISNEAKVNLNIKVDPHNLAYVIYTSGSTGKPKGVMVEHRNLVDYVFGLNKKTQINECHTFALVSTIATDLGNTVIYSSLLSGGALHLFTKESVSNIEYLHKYFNEHSIDCLKIVPSHWKALMMQDKLLLPKKLLVFGGEALQSDLVEKIWMSGSDCVVVNHYGPTETTIGKLLHVTNPEFKYANTIPIGKPFSNTKIYILSKDMQPCPAGVPGQLYISGDGVARGYYNNAELTKEKFVRVNKVLKVSKVSKVHKVGKVYKVSKVDEQDIENRDGIDEKDSGSLMYGTGDLVKYLPDGNVMFIGRVDDQVKIRGYRIELGEIENILQQCELVSRAVVLAREDKQGNKRLSAYIIPKGEFNRDGITSWLKEKLPEYMVPSVLMEVKEFPLTANGKIDRNALPDPDTLDLSSEGYTSPRNEAERKLAEIWQEVLEVDQVGINDDFFELGGHSLLAVRLVSLIRKEFDVEMPIGDIFDYPTIAKLAGQLEVKYDAEVLPPIEVPAVRPDRIPLSFSQERLWFIDKLEGSTLYHVPSVLSLKGKLNKEALVNSLRSIIDRHEILRTAIREEEGKGYQFIKDSEGWELQIEDGSKYIGETEKLRVYIKQLINAPFVLSKDYMLRGNLIRLSEEEHVLVVTLHHIASDGWSTSIIVRELVELYGSFEEGREAKLAALPLQYADYAIWQRNYLHGEVLEKKLRYWKEKLDGVKPIDMPTDFKRKAFKSKKGSFEVFHLSKELKEELQLLSQRQGVSLFMTILSAYKILLYRYSGQQDICIGTSVAGRQQQELEGLIGFFVNTLVMRSEVNGDKSFNEFLMQLRENTLSDFEHQDVSFEKIVDAVVKERDASRNPLVQVMFIFHNEPEVVDIRAKHLQISREAAEHGTSKFELTFSFTETDDGIRGSVEYRTDLYSQKTITRMIDHFKELIASIVKKPESSIDSLSMMNEGEENHLLYEFNGAFMEYPKDSSIIDVFKEQTVKTPDNIALIFEDRKLTYKELNEHSNQLAHYLRSKGVREGTMVPVCIERSAELIIGILGILKAGGIYVPIDPEYPEERITYMLKDTCAAIMLSSKNSRLKLPATLELSVIETDSDLDSVNGMSPENIETDINPDHLAYVIYTSGSMGRPKGVMVTHGNVVSLVKGASYASLSSDDILLSTGSPSFDATTFEYWGMLLNGGQLVLCTENKLLDSEQLKKEIKTRGVNKMWFTSSWFNQLVDNDISVFQRLTTILAGGEKLSETHIEIIRQTYPHIEIINGYGPTENTTFSLTYRIGNVKKLVSTIPIGRPLENRSVYILDAKQKLVPIGVRGEIFVGGAGVSLGYLNRDDLTAEKFFENPFRQGDRMYRTGDSGRWREDGNVEYLGRIDEQVKVRGYRIELGEIESVLQESDLVRHSVVIAAEDKEGNKRLAGYVVPNDVFDKEGMIAYLRKRLPEYMIPALWIKLDNLPLTSNGKVDKRALPDPDTKEGLSDEFVAPRTETEKIIAEIWEELFEIENVGVNDNFFNLGGDSIRIINVLSKIRKAFNKEIDIGGVYEAENLEKLAMLIDNYPALESSSNETILDTTSKEIAQIKDTILSSMDEAELIEDIYPMSDIQSGMVYASIINPELAVYHDQFVFQLTKKIDINIFKKALGMMVKKHSILRTAFNLDLHTEGLQIVYKSIPVKVDHLEMLNANEDEARSFIKDYLSEQRAKPFEVNKAPLWRATLIYLKNHTILLFQFHHSILDGWSVASFSTEVNNLYLNLLTHPEQEILPPLKCTYKDFVLDSIAEKKNDESREFWVNEMSEYKRLEIFTHEPTFQKINKIYSEEFFEILNRKTKKDGLNIKTLFFGAYLYSLNLLTYEDELTVGIVTNNRPLKEDGDKVLGCFLNTVPFRFKTGKNTTTWKTYFEEIERKLKELKKRDRITFLDIVKITDEKALNDNPFFDVLFNFVNFHVLDNLEKDLHNSDQAETKDELKGDEALGHAITNTYLDCTARTTGDKLTVGFMLRKKLKCGKNLNDLAGYFENVIKCYVENYEDTLSTAKIIPEKEIQKVLVDFNDTSVEFPKGKTLIDLFDEQVLKTPDNIALVFEDKTMTYRELNESSNQFANFLISQGAETETLIPICIDRSLEMLIGIIGIMKSGAAYVPVDPEYPEERIKYILEDTAAKIVVTNKERRLKLPADVNISIIEIDSDRSEISKQPNGNAKVKIMPQNTSYVIYTSGSTGKPKGVINEHGGVVNRLMWAQDYFRLTPEDSVLQKTTFCFDVSVWELLWPLFSGSRLVIAAPEGHKDTGYLRSIIDNEKITMIHFVPSMLEIFLSELETGDCPGLKKVLCSGEALKPSHVEQFINKLPDAELHNLYGPTEAAIDVTYWSLIDKYIDRESIPIGRPVANTKIYIQNKNNEPVPIGCTGQIYIGGVQVARGYLNKPELTQQNFITDPFSKDGGGRLYRTGDLGRWLPDGNIEYLGRIDNQVKIRGFRIELGEIEKVLQDCELVRQSVVLTQQSKEGNIRLIGYVVPEGKFDKEGIVNYLSGVLPEYMVPALWVELEILPLTPNGKLDRKALPDPDASELLRNEYLAPRNEIEKALAEIWKDLLHTERVGINDNFFELGGDSIITIQVLSRARRLGYELKPKDIFIHHTIANLALIIEERSASAITGEQGLLTGRSGLLPIQQAYFEEAVENISHFNQSVLLTIDKRITPQILNTAVEILTENHDALRFRYHKEDGQWIQEYGTETGKLNMTDHSSASEDTLAVKIKEAADKFQRSLSIEKGEIAKFVLIQTPDKELHNRLFIVIHHLATDGVSWRILLDDLEMLLTELQKTGKAEPGSKSSSYRQWYESLENYSKSRRLLSQLPYWESASAGFEPLKTDIEYSGQVRGKDIMTQTMKLEADKTRLLLQEVPRVYHTEINDILLCALALTLNESETGNKVVVGLEGHGRESISEDIDTNRTVGWFTSLYPLLLEISSVRDLSDSIKAVKEQIRGIPDKGLGYGVLKYINKEERLSGKKCWDIVFNYLGQLDNVVNTGKWLSVSGESRGMGSNEENTVGYKLAVNSMVQEGELVLNWSYSSLHFKKETMEHLVEKYKSTLESLIDHCIERKKSGAVYTPSDYGLGSDVSFEELDQFLKVDDKDNIMSF